MRGWHRVLRTASVAVVLALIVAGSRQVPGKALAAGTTYYVSMSGGNDGNSGTSPSAPWQTLAKVDNTTFQPGDRILFRAGDAWSGQLHPLGSGTSAGTIAVDMYGSGNKPIINGGGTVAATVYLSNQQYWDIQNLEVTNNSATRTYLVGVRADNSTGSTLSYIHISNLYVHNVSGYTSGYFGQNGGIAVEASATSSTLWDDVLIQGNAIDTVDRIGIFVGPIDQNVASGRNTNVVIQNNTINNSGGDGILTFFAHAPLVQYNVVSNGGTRVGSPPNPPAGTYSNGCDAAIFTNNVDGGILQYNEVYNNRGCDGEAFDLDGATTSSVVQYNYSHDNPQGFMTFYSGGASGNNAVRYNISQNDGSCCGGDFGQDIFNRVYDASGAQIYNNTIYVGSALGAQAYIVEGAGSASAATFTNNIIDDQSNNGGYQTVGAWDHNLFYGNHPANEPGDANKITSDPMFVNPGGASIGRATAAAYDVQSGSPALGSGALVSNNGGQDFFGNAVSATATPNRGAYNGPGVSPSNGVNFAKGKSATASSTTSFSTAFGAGNATDGNNGDFWSNQLEGSSAVNEWVYVDLGGATAFDRVVLYPRYDGGGNALAFPSAFQIQGSNDAANWTTLDNETNFPNPAGNAGVSFWVGPQTYRYVRVLATVARTDGSNYYVQLQELEVDNS